MSRRHSRRLHSLKDIGRQFKLDQRFMNTPPSISMNIKCVFALFKLTGRVSTSCCLLPDICKSLTAFDFSQVYTYFPELERLYMGRTERDPGQSSSFRAAGRSNTYFWCAKHPLRAAAVKEMTRRRDRSRGVSVETKDCRTRAGVTAIFTQLENILSRHGGGMVAIF